MKANYDFSKARRGAVIPAKGSKTRITIRLDSDLVEWFKSKAEDQCAGNYQTMLNDALRSYTEQQDQNLETLLRKVLREELKKAS
ncbi:MAG: CopG family transcriptional regulator [Spartobacteria bacterium]|nr:CopG family transcriptional regulator [Spartobacteria bacterium]